MDTKTRRPKGRCVLHSGAVIDSLILSALDAESRGNARSSYNLRTRAAGVSSPTNAATILESGAAAQSALGDHLHSSQSLRFAGEIKASLGLHKEAAALFRRAREERSLSNAASNGSPGHE